MGFLDGFVNLFGGETKSQVQAKLNAKEAELQKKEKEGLAAQMEQYKKLQEAKSAEMAELAKEHAEKEQRTREECRKREEGLSAERQKAIDMYEKKEHERETLNREDRQKAEKEHKDFIKTKDSELREVRENEKKNIAEMRKEREVAEAVLQKEIKGINDQRLAREKETQETIMQIHRDRQAREAELFQQMIDIERLHGDREINIIQAHSQTLGVAFASMASVPQAIQSDKDSAALALKQGEIRKCMDDLHAHVNQLAIANSQETNEGSSLRQTEARIIHESVQNMSVLSTNYINEIEKSQSVDVKIRDEALASAKAIKKACSSLSDQFLKPYTLLIKGSLMGEYEMDLICGLGRETQDLRDAVDGMPTIHKASAFAVLADGINNIRSSQQESAKAIEAGPTVERLAAIRASTQAAIAKSVDDKKEEDEEKLNDQPVDPAALVEQA